MKYIDSIHFIAGEGMDFFATVYRNDDGPWEMRARFRCYNDENVFDSTDRKRVYEVLGKDASPECLKAMRAPCQDLANMMAEAGHCKYYDVIELQCNESDPKVFFEMGSREWCHVKMGQEAEDYLAKMNAENN